MKLEDFIQEVRNLMPCPHILPELLKVLEDVDSDPWEIVNLVKLDAALTAQVLALANSAYYSFPEPCTELNEAINRIGFQELYKLVGVVLCKRLVGRDLQTYCVEEDELWQHSLACAVTMEQIAKKIGLNVPMAYTLGLLADIGKIALNQVGQEAYAQVFQRIEKEALSMSKAETAEIGFDHSMTTAALLQKWNFPEEARVPVSYQYNPMECPEPREMACALHVALWVVAAVGFNAGRDAWAFEMDERALQQLKLGRDDLEIFMVGVRERIDEVRSFLKILPDKKGNAA